MYRFRILTGPPSSRTPGLGLSQSNSHPAPPRAFLGDPLSPDLESVVISKNGTPVLPHAIIATSTELCGKHQAAL